MKDLRTPEEIFIDEKNIPTNDSILDKLYNLLFNIIKYIHILYLYKYHIIFIFVILTILFPETIGSYVSYLVNSFKKGFYNTK